VISSGAIAAWHQDGVSGTSRQRIERTAKAGIASSKAAAKNRWMADDAQRDKKSINRRFSVAPRRHRRESFSFSGSRAVCVNVYLAAPVSCWLRYEL